MGWRTLEKAEAGRNSAVHCQERRTTTEKGWPVAYPQGDPETHGSEAFRFHIALYVFLADYTHPDELNGGNVEKVITDLVNGGMVLNGAMETFVRRLFSNAQPSIPTPVAQPAAGAFNNLYSYCANICTHRHHGRGHDADDYGDFQELHSDDASYDATASAAADDSASCDEACTAD